MKYKISGKNKSNNSILFPSVEDAFLKTPVASSNDCTGYAVTVPVSETEAESYESILDVPCTASTKKHVSKNKAAK